MAERMASFKSLKLGEIKRVSDLSPYTIAEGLKTTRDVDAFFATFLRLKYPRRLLIPALGQYLPPELVSQIHQGLLRPSQIPSRLLEKQRIRPDVMYFQGFAVSIVIQDHFPTFFTREAAQESATQVILRGKLAIGNKDKRENIGEINRHLLFAVPRKGVDKDRIVWVFTERRNLNREEEIMRTVNELYPAPDSFAQQREISDALIKKARAESVRRASLAEDGTAYWTSRHPISIGLGSLGKRS